MMIHKYVLELKACNVIEIPVFHRILDIQKQAGKFVMWAEVDPLSKMFYKEISIFGTGDNVPLWANHIATVQDGDCVWHFYD